VAIERGKEFAQEVSDAGKKKKNGKKRALTCGKVFRCGWRVLAVASMAERLLGKKEKKIKGK